jgi:hypothetical protein
MTWYTLLLTGYVAGVVTMVAKEPLKKALGMLWGKVTKTNA